MKITIDEKLTGRKLYDFLVQNKNALIAQKKSETKKADAVTCYGSFVRDNGDTIKANKPITEDVSSIKVSTVINTTNWFDSHEDVHIPGLWKKSLSENQELFLLEEHKFSFRGIITDEVQASTKTMKWADLGLNKTGETEALIFINNIHKSRNEFMFNEYRKGHVKNHSVGMRYVRLTMAINDEDYKEEFAEWEKYFDQIANKEAAEDNGYFFAVKEAKVIEGSAVPRGSNIITPTLNNNIKSMQADTQDPPSYDTDSAPSKSFIEYIHETKFLNF